MTCIIGLVEDGRIYMGGDSMAAASWDARITKLRKVFHLKNFLIGYTTSFRMGQLLQYCLEVTPQNGEDDMAYMVNVFAEAVRQLFKDNGFSKIDSNQEEGGVFLVGYKKHLYRIDNDFQVNEFQDGFDACGSGEGYALGAMKALGKTSPKEQIVQALEIAGHFSNGVEAPYYVEMLED